MDIPTPRLFKGMQPEVDLPDIPLGRQLRSVPLVAVPAKPALDLAGRPKVVLTIGAGSSGKTMWLRWAAEMALARDPDCSAIFAAVGDRRDLAHYFSVSQPLSFNPVLEARWLEALLAHCMDQKVSAAIDLDGGDASLTTLVSQQDDFVAMVERSGVRLVAIYMLTPRVTDLTTLATMESSGFRPAATALVLNEGTSDASVDFDVAFGPIQRHADFRSAVARGAVVIRMPRLYAAAAVELRRIRFCQARDSADGVEHQLTAFDRGRVARWLIEMDEAMAPLVKAGWVP